MIQSAVMDDGLTERQRAIFDFIVEFIRENGGSPSVREIGDRFEIRSPNGVMCHLKALQKKGRISGVDNGGGHGTQMSRTIRIVAGRTCRCCGGLGRILDGSEPDA